ncbi:hypothetical protein CVT25_008581 [Psilocybe cyanescens]|uniref:Transmembrane protein n=1 Tax=Psilocybe cyanescens TaxID=93625 RepID=A0A409XNA7_PSICY|nr:hypothetical protein CVT25_008581 [Psilocybe cyanescens]
MASKLIQILDDNAPDFKYSGGQWTLSTLVQWYQQTSNYPAFVTATQFGSFSLTFEGGKSIAFIGNTPSDPSSQTATVSIDGGAPSTITYPGTPPAYVQWYQSPTLSDGTHNITVGHLGGTAVDYALIEVGQNTPLSGKTIVVDDDDPSIQYSGSWIRDTDEFDAGSLPDGFPLHNGTHRGSQVGDTITLRFFGTSYSVYGIFSWENLGVLSATYTLDGSSTTQSYPVTTSSPQFIQGDKEAVNLQYFSQDNLSAGEHTLVINITESQNVLYALDYITYSPSFSTLATMPNLSNKTATSTGGSSVLSSSATSSSGSTTPTGLQNPQPQARTKSTHVGPIAGGVVGAILVLALLAIVLIWIRRRRVSSDKAAVSHSNISQFILEVYQSMCSTKNRRLGATSGYSDSIPTGQVAVPFNHYGETRSSTSVISPFQDNDGTGHVRTGSLADLKRARLGASSPSRGNIAMSPLSASPTHGSASPTVTTKATSTVTSMYMPDSNRESSPPAYDVVSNIRHHFRYTDEWHVSNTSQWYGGTSHAPNIWNGPGSFTVFFEGVSIAFYGMAPSLPASQGISVSIDGKPSFTSSYDGLAPDTYRQWYQSPNLPGGSHNITVNLVSGASVDFAAIRPSPNTSLKGRTIIIDDDNFAIKYTGGWRRSLNNIGSLVTPGSPFRNSTHQTWSAGDSLSFSFTGTSVAVYGIFSWENLGSLSATYTLDGISQLKSYSVTVGSPQFASQVGQVPNFLFYASGSISSGEHTLIINITQSMNQSFILDYFTYLPSFTLSSQMPNYTATISTTAISSAIPTGVTRTFSSTIGLPFKKKSQDNDFLTGPVIGGLLGGILFLAFGCLLAYYVLRRRFESRYVNIKTDTGNDSSRPLMQDNLRGRVGLRPTSALSHRSVSPFPFSSTPTTLYSAQSFDHSKFPQRARDVQKRPSEANTQTAPQDLQGFDSALLERGSDSQREQQLYAVRNDRFTSSSNTLRASHPCVNLDDRRSTRECSLTFHNDDVNQCGFERVMQAREVSVGDNSGMQRRAPATREQVPQAGGCFATESHSAHQMPNNQPRLTPVRRNFALVPQSVNDTYSTFENIRGSQTRIPSEVNQDTLRQGQLSPDNRSLRTLPIQALDRLTPVRRQFVDPPMTAPAVMTRASPIASAFPRLSAILLRHHSRSGSLGSPQKGGNGYDGQTSAPPAYDSLSPRRDTSTASWARRQAS